MLIVDMLRLLAVLAAVSAFDPSLTFHYVKYPRVFRRNEVACQVCYGEFDCLSMEQCSYNAAAAEVLSEDDGMSIVNEALTAKVNSMMYDLILEDSLKEYNECIPLVSSYTTCNKDNICLGCKTCDCDETGHWSCNNTHRCSRTRLNIDHQMLTSVVDELKSSSRYKRSYDEPEETTQSLFENLGAWMYVTEPGKLTTKHIKHSTTIGPTTRTERSANDDTNSLAFDDILSNDNLDDWIKSAEKDTNEIKHQSTESSQFLRFLKNIEEGIDEKVHKVKATGNMELVTDIQQYLKDHSNNNEPVNSFNDQPNSVNAIMTDTEDFDFEKQQSYINSVATVVKRNVQAINETATKNETMNLNKTSAVINETKNMTNPEKELQHIVDVVNVLINNERKEINHLNYLKDSLLKFSRKYKNYSNLTDIILETHNISNDYSRKHGDWKIDMLNFYVLNLKKDAKATIRDIYAIQKLKNLGVAPAAKSISNLKPLLIALTSYYLNNSRDNRYIKNHKLPHQFSSFINSFSKDITASRSASANATTNSEPKPQRRVYEPNQNNVYKIKQIKRALTRILVVIDNDTPSTSILSPLKFGIKNILNRIVTKLHKEPPVHPSVRDPNFNLTKILTTVTEEWRNIQIDVQRLNPADRLHHMKLLHLTVSQGIDKLEDALMSIHFGYSRRMTFIQNRTGKDLVSDASKFLSALENGIKNFVFSADIKKSTPKLRSKEKSSIWQHIKNAFSNSKNGLVKYFQNKFQKPKSSYIFNDMVKKRVEDVNKQKFLEVMKRWQENFDNYHGRQKRSVKQYAKRMKNIVPKYLRKIKENTKINSALYASKLAEIRNNVKLADKSKYVSHANKFAETRKNKVHGEKNKLERKSKNKEHSNMNKLAEIKKAKVRAEVKTGINKNKVHRKGNELVGSKKNDVHNEGNKHAGKSKNNVHVNFNRNVGLKKYNVHTMGNSGTKKSEPKLKNKTALQKSTAKRGVRTQGHH